MLLVEGDRLNVVYWMRWTSEATLLLRSVICLDRVWTPIGWSVRRDASLIRTYLRVCIKPTLSFEYTNQQVNGYVPHKNTLSPIHRKLFTEHLPITYLWLLTPLSVLFLDSMRWSWNTLYLGTCKVETMFQMVLLVTYPTRTYQHSNIILAKDVSIISHPERS